MSSDHDKAWLRREIAKKISAEADHRKTTAEKKIAAMRTTSFLYTGEPVSSTYSPYRYYRSTAGGVSYLRSRDPSSWSPPGLNPAGTAGRHHLAWDVVEDGSFRADDSHWTVATRGTCVYVSGVPGRLEWSSGGSIYIWSTSGSFSGSFTVTDAAGASSSGTTDPATTEIPMPTHFNLTTDSFWLDKTGCGGPPPHFHFDIYNWNSLREDDQTFAILFWRERVVDVFLKDPLKGDAPRLVQVDIPIFFVVTKLDEEEVLVSLPQKYELGFASRSEEGFKEVATIVGDEFPTPADYWKLYGIEYLHSTVQARLVAVHGVEPPTP